jgi:hypothetical protein
MLRGDGWYGHEPDMGHWARSPATLLIFAPVAQRAECSIVLSALADINAPNGLGTITTLTMRVNDADVRALLVRPQEQVATTVQLQAGWNRIELSRAEPSLRPADAIAGSSDQRELSFAALQIDLSPR